MNIDYTAIIEKANQRKDCLLRLTDLLEQAKEMDDKLLDIMHWAKSVQTELRNLDAEGRSLLPKRVALALECNGNVIMHLEKARVEHFNGYEVGLKRWYEHE